jgi:hypothetical protein
MASEWALASQVASQMIGVTSADGRNPNTEGEGFEPPRACALMVFKVTFELSAIVRRRSLTSAMYFTLARLVR